MADQKQPTGRKLPASLARPVWADPRYIGAVNDWKRTRVVSAGAGTRILAPNNPLRWAIGFALDFTAVGTCSIAPGDPKVQCGRVIAKDPLLNWFTLFQYGPMVCGEWYGTWSGTDTVNVIEVYTL